MSSLRVKKVSDPTKPTTSKKTRITRQQQVRGKRKRTSPTTAHDKTWKSPGIPSSESPSLKKSRPLGVEAEGTRSQSKPLKICDVGRIHRVGIVAATLQELRTKITSRLPITNNSFEVVLEEDCTRIDDEEYFQMLPENTVLMVLNKGEQWTESAASTSLAADSCSRGYVEVDGPSSVTRNHLHRVAGKIARNPAVMAFLPKVDLEVVRGANIGELQVLLHQSKDDAQFIQDACERRLDEMIRSDDANALLKLYHRAKTETQGGSSVEHKSLSKKRNQMGCP